MLQDYIFSIGLPLLEKKGEHWNFRCTICGDSKKNEYKRRGWILNKNGKLFVYCHNCGASMSFEYFLKKWYPHIYSDYKKENFRSNKRVTTIDEVIPKKKEIIFPIKNLTKIIDLSSDHVCHEYVKNRMIPFKFWDILYYCSNFQKEVNQIFPEKFVEYPESDERLVIPFFNRDRISYIQGRTISDSYLRYVTIELLSDLPKIYGIERIDISKEIKIVEGPIDSLFLDNALGMGSSSVNYNDLLSIAPKSNFVFVYDLETRNRAIIKKIYKIITAGYRVCLIPHTYKKYGKDINQFIENGLTKEEIQDIIKENTFFGLKAKARLNFWKKC